MGCEQDLGADDLLHLGCVPVVEQAVGREVLVHRAEVAGVLERPTGARNPGRSVHHDAGRLDQSGPHQGGQGQRGRRRVAAGHGHPGGADDLVPEQLGQPVREVGQQLGSGVLGAVPLRVGRRILQPEVGREVQHPRHPVLHLGHDRLAGAVGQAAEHDVEPVHGLGRVRLEGHVAVDGAQARIEIGHRRARLGVPRGQHHLHLRMARHQPHELGAGVPRRPHDPDAHGRYSIRGHV